jgi:hypothetical protein
MSSLTENQKNEIINLYKDPEQGYSSAKVIYEKLNKKYKLKDIKQVLESLETVQMFKPTNKAKRYIPIASGCNTYQCDLTFYSNLKKFNSGYHVIFNIINMNTKKSYSYPMKDKNAKSICENFNKFMKDVKITPTSISFDSGSEFNNNDFLKLLKDNEIQYIMFNKAVSYNAMYIIESFNRTLRNKLDKYMTTNDTNKWVDVLDKIVYNYNNTIHSTHGYKPGELDQEFYFDEDSANRKIEALENLEYNIGDNVRISSKKDELFKKGKKTYGKIIYEIIEKKGNGYIIKNEKNEKFVLPYQMQKVNKDEVEKMKNEKMEKQREKVNKEQKQKRKIRKENLDIDLDKIKKLEKLKKKLAY